MRMAMPVLALLVAIAPQGCAADDTDDRFPCGNGSCERGAEICVIGGPDMCSTCVPAPAACDPASCDCLPPATDPAFGDARCLDTGTCEEVEGGAAVTCDEIDWACG